MHGKMIWFDITLYQENRKIICSCLC